MNTALGFGGRARGWALLLAAVLVGQLVWGEDDHAGHDHGPEVAESPAEDSHAGHDHGAEPAGEENGDDHSGHDHAEEEAGIRLTPEQHKQFGIVVDVARPGALRKEVMLSGEVTFNEDRVVHLVPRVAGIVREVRKTVGDRVAEGESLVVLDSRELADAKSVYLAARARADLAQTLFTREQTLREQAVSSEQDYLEAQQAAAEARIVLRASELNLHALGYDETALESLNQEPHLALTRFEVRAPMTGTVTARHASLGESLEATSDIFTIADLDGVWVNLTVYAKDLAAVRPGQVAVIRAVDGGLVATGTVDRISPFIDPVTRSATARVGLANADGAWTPGAFVRGAVQLTTLDASVVVPNEAVQTLEGREVVFVEHEGAFEATPVTVGRADGERVEVISGLNPGARYVAAGAFNLKATVVTSSMDAHAGHGH